MKDFYNPKQVASGHSTSHHRATGGVVVTEPGSRSNTGTLASPLRTMVRRCERHGKDRGHPWNFGHVSNNQQRLNDPLDYPIGTPVGSYQVT